MPTIPTTKKICPVDAGIPSLFEPSAGAELVDQKIGHLHIKTIIRWILLLQIFQNLFSFTVLIQCLQYSCQIQPGGNSIVAAVHQFLQQLLRFSIVFFCILFVRCCLLHQKIRKHLLLKHSLTFRKVLASLFQNAHSLFHIVLIQRCICG